MAILRRVTIDIPADEAAALAEVAWKHRKPGKTLGALCLEYVREGSLREYERLNAPPPKEEADAPQEVR